MPVGSHPPMLQRRQRRLRRCKRGSTASSSFLRSCRFIFSNARGPKAKASPNARTAPSSRDPSPSSSNRLNHETHSQFLKENCSYCRPEEGGPSSSHILPSPAASPESSGTWLWSPCSCVRAKPSLPPCRPSVPVSQPRPRSNRSVRISGHRIQVGLQSLPLLTPSPFLML